MQEKTLEEEFKERFTYTNRREELCWLTDFADHPVDPKDVLDFISSREEKAREEGHLEGYKERQEEEKDFIKDNYEKWKEEGRKEGFKLGVEDRDEYWKAYPIEESKYEAVTQYKEELLVKLSTFEIKEIGLKYDDNIKDTVQEIVDITLSEVKKLIWNV